MISGIGSGYSSYYGSASAIKGNCNSSGRADSGISGSDDDNPLKKLFTKLDSDGDGTISKSELTTAASAASDSQDSDAASGDIDVDKLLGMLDQNGDGSVGENEFASVFAPPPAGEAQGSGESLASSGGNGGRLPPPPPPKSSEAQTSSDTTTQATSTPYGQLVQAVLRQYQSIGSYGTSSGSSSGLSVAA
ncbi:EF-hand domain-containing protein [Pseudomonas sp. EpS/L25]|uniref:EF-hand domain-containing protein n=1 Tax=Pseudomonas sp. EpS/L25 TaxID=1749078 RepID=UPI0007433D1A|nr:EF-hand domain-containing protein [Pseudomonas sp. EpS/L25]KUM43085.1 calcium-binding protein [Pseudomonas sp. EpS/L25]